MARMVKCVKLSRELPGIKWKPWEDELGQRIYDSVSQEAWKMWLEHSKMLINEYRLLVQPLVLGRGQALFDQLPDSRHVELAEATPFPSGILVQVYRPKPT